METVVRQKCIAGIALRCNEFITVMQAAEVRDLKDLANARDLPSIRKLLLQPHLGPN